MRHGKKINHLSRKAGHRKAMLSNMANSLITHKRIQTTLPKAKALRKYIEPIITRAKKDNTHSRRMVFSDLRDKEAVKELFITVADKVGDRPGGYTRIIKLGNRLGDNADLAMIELVDFNENLLEEKAKSGGRRRRRRRRGGGKKSDQQQEESTEAASASVAHGEEGTNAEEGKEEETATGEAEGIPSEEESSKEEVAEEEDKTQAEEDSSDQEAEAEETREGEKTDEESSDEESNEEDEKKGDDDEGKDSDESEEDKKK